MAGILDQALAMGRRGVGALSNAASSIGNTVGGWVNQGAQSLAQNSANSAAAASTPNLNNAAGLPGNRVMPAQSPAPGGVGVAPHVTPVGTDPLAERGIARNPAFDPVTGRSRPPMQFDPNVKPAQYAPAAADDDFLAAGVQQPGTRPELNPANAGSEDVKAWAATRQGPVPQVTNDATAAATEAESAAPGLARRGLGAVGRFAGRAAALSAPFVAGARTVNSDPATTAAQSAGSGNPVVDHAGQFASNLGSGLTFGALAPESLAAAGRNIGTFVGRLMSSAKDNAAYDKLYGSPYVTGTQLQAQAGKGVGSAPPPDQIPDGGSTGGTTPVNYQPGQHGGADANGFQYQGGHPDFFAGSSFDPQNAGKGGMYDQSGKGVTSGGLPIMRFNSESDPEFQQRARAIDTTYGMLNQLKQQYANSHFLDERKMLLNAMGQLNGQLGTLTGQGVTRANAAEGNTVQGQSALMQRELEGIRMRFAQYNADRNYNLSAAQYGRALNNDQFTHQDNNMAAVDKDLDRLYAKVPDAKGNMVDNPEKADFYNFLLHNQINPAHLDPAKRSQALSQLKDQYDYAKLHKQQALDPTYVRRFTNYFGITTPMQVTAGQVKATGTHSAGLRDLANGSASLPDVVIGRRMVSGDNGSSVPATDIAANRELTQQAFDGLSEQAAQIADKGQRDAYLKKNNVPLDYYYGNWAPRRMAAKRGVQ